MYSQRYYRRIVLQSHGLTSNSAKYGIPAPVYYSTLKHTYASQKPQEDTEKSLLKRKKKVIDNKDTILSNVGNYTA
jgi:hypothetical protein